MEKKNEILNVSLDFALAIITFTEVLEQMRKYVIAKQLLRAGTSIGANIREAQNVHSRKDFVARIIIALKESSETEYWLILCERSTSYPSPGNLINDIGSIKKLLYKIVSTSIKSK